MVFNTLARTATRISSGINPQIAIKEHIDEWNRNADPHIFSDEPVLTGVELVDAWLAGAAELESSMIGLDCPAWANAPERFLSEPLFIGGPNARAYALIETPDAFRSRNVYCGASSIRCASTVKAP